MGRSSNDRRSHDNRQGAEKRLVLGYSPERVARAGPFASGPAAGSYTATVCVTDPGAGSTIVGATSVIATVAFSGTTPPGVQRVIFYLDGLYLLRD